MENFMFMDKISDIVTPLYTQALNGIRVKNILFPIFLTKWVVEKQYQQLLLLQA